MSDTTRKYSLWLTIEEGTTASDRYGDLIEDFAETYDDAPAFVPHVTVGGDVVGKHAMLAETARELAMAIGRINAEFGRFRCSTTCHQCVFRLVEPSLELFRLHRAA